MTQLVAGGHGAWERLLLSSAPLPSPPNCLVFLFERVDQSPDDQFYLAPRFVAHLDDATINALTDYYRQFIPPHSRVLDLMSSWISHLPDELELDRVTLAVSIQYLIQPYAVISSVRDVLRDGGAISIAMSHRLFPTKAVQAFQQLQIQDRIRLILIFSSASKTRLQFLFVIAVVSCLPVRKSLLCVFGTTTRGNSKDDPLRTHRVG